MNHTPKILVVGSFVMDQIASTDVFPAEGETVLGKRFTKAPGGKGANQAVQAARLGADVTIVGKLGLDANGDEMLETCRKANLHTQHVLRDSTEPSGGAVIILESAQDGQSHNRIIVLPGSNMTIEQQDVSFLETSIGSYDLVMLQLEIPMKINQYIASIAHKKNIPVMLNPAPSAPIPADLMEHLTYISPNEHEAFDLTGIRIAHHGTQVDLSAARAAAESLQAKGVPHVLITLGDGGAVLFDDTGFTHCPAVANVRSVDPTAAGDSFVAAFCVGICSQWGAYPSLQFAAHSAALTVSRMGAMPSLPVRQEVDAYMKQDSLSFGQAR